MNKMFENCKKVSFAEEAKTVDQWLTDDLLLGLLGELGFEQDENFVVNDQDSDECNRSFSIEFELDKLSSLNSSYPNQNLLLAA